MNKKQETINTIKKKIDKKEKNFDSQKLFVNLLRNIGQADFTHFYRNTEE